MVGGVYGAGIAAGPGVVDTVGDELRAADNFKDIVRPSF